ncbi:MAG: FAD:protein FMN transferase [Acidipropionibacterium sp.]|jgi:thiamine biosynthesis lipoprotein|nr:FAD:protein FMN transferase [Acidipropionibacterium sp.]
MAEPPGGARRPASHTFATMGTLGQVSWRPVGLRLAGELEARCRQIESRLTRFTETSEISRLTSDWEIVSSDALAVLRAAGDLQTETGGAFNALLGAQVRAWERTAAGGPLPPVLTGEQIRVPAGKQIRVSSGDPVPTGERDGLEASPDASGPATGSSPAEPRIEVDGNRARLVGAGRGAVDLGAIAKGYAADVLRDLAVDRGATDVLVSLGSSSMAVAGEPARIGLAAPWQGIDRFGVLVLESGSLSVSADPGVRLGPGMRRSHLLDSRSGIPAITDLCEVVVCGPRGMVCEAWSTAMLAMGLDAAIRADQRHPEFRTVFMTVDGRVLADPDLEITADPGVQDRLAALRNREDPSLS